MRRTKLMMVLLCLLQGAIALPALAQETDTYSYDALGRLVSTSRAGGANNGQTVATNYDPAGNRTSYSVAGVGSTISIASASANEGSPLTFTVMRSAPTSMLNTAVSASWTTSGGTAVAGTNYTTSSGTVSFAAGATSQTITVPTIDDHVYELNPLQMTVALSTPSSGAILGTSLATGLIVNIDSSSNASLAIASAGANEGSPLSFVVTRFGNTSSAVTVKFATSNGTAVAGTNYTSMSGTLSFAANVISKTITVPTIDDHVVTPNLTMTLALSSPSAGAMIATGNATGGIANIDTAWTANITAGSWNICFLSCGTTVVYGYVSANSTGSMSSTNFNGYTITTISNTGSQEIFTLMGATSAPPNLGWTTINVPGLGKLNRSSATYTVSGNNATWTWVGTGQVVSGTVTITS